MKVALAVVLGLFIAFFAYSSLNRSAENKSAEAFYFPKANVYYDAAADEYFISHQGAWIGTRDLSPARVADLGEKIKIPYSKPVWSNNNYHRLVHSIDLYASEARIKSAYTEDSLRQVPRKKPPVVSVPEDEEAEKEEEKPKKGLKKLLDKIFGGKKDKEDQS